ncbi:MAG TPA: ribosome-associated translation inhibitor RaiA [Coriobacteriia bacterium]
MNVNIKGRHMSVAPEIQAYATDKIGRVVKLIDGPTTEVEIELFAEKNPSIQNSQVAEVTIFSKGPVIRAREAATDMHAAIDLVSDKLERRVNHLRGKIKDKHKAGPRGFQTAETFLPEEEEPEPAVVKTKRVNMKPMTTDEAILQMELLGHDFFVFMTPESEDINVLYKRRDGDYGLISPEPR